MAEPKWQRCRKPDGWFCDECRHCTDPECKNCGPDGRRKWMKHLGEDIALCDQCWPAHHQKYEEAHNEAG